MIQFICHSIIISIAIAIYAMFARECYLAIKDFIYKPDWRDKVITREESDRLHKLAKEERAFNAEFPIINTTALWKELDNWNPSYNLNRRFNPWREDKS